MYLIEYNHETMGIIFAQIVIRDEFLLPEERDHDEYIAASFDNI